MRLPRWLEWHVPPSHQSCSYEWKNLCVFSGFFPVIFSSLCNNCSSCTMVKDISPQGCNLWNSFGVHANVVPILLPHPIDSPSVRLQSPSSEQNSDFWSKVHKYRISYHSKHGLLHFCIIIKLVVQHSALQVALLACTAHGCKPAAWSKPLGPL